MATAATLTAPRAEAEPGARGNDRPWRYRFGLLLVIVVTFAGRLVLGMQVRLDGDEATIAYAAFRITQGHLAAVEPNAHYLGAFEAYVIAPFVAVFGTTLLAVRAAMAAVGAAFVVAMYLLGRQLFGTRAAGLVSAAVAAFFPLFAFTWDVKSRGGYAESLLLSALLLALAVQVGWRRPSISRWALLGLVAGVGLWNDLIMGIVVVVVGVALLMRAPAQGWGQTVRGAVVAGITTLIGWSPWLLWQATNGAAGLHGLPKYTTGLREAVRGFISQELPIFVGSASSCQGTSGLYSDVAQPAIWALGLAGLVVVGTVAVRRRAILDVLKLRPTALQPVEMVLALGAVAVALVLVGRFNGIPCEPRYLLPLTIPAVVAVTAIVVALRSVAGRVVVGAVAAAWLVLSGFTASLPTVDSRTGTIDGTGFSVDADAVSSRLVAMGVPAVIGDYWLMRPIQYAGGGRFSVGTYDGYVGFPEDDQAALTSAHAAWLFVPGQPFEANFVRLLAQRSITATKVEVGGLNLYVDLSSPVTASDVVR